jgi:hypothetical protein
MQFAVENPVRLVALVGALATLGGGFLVLKSTQGGDATASQPKLLHTSVAPRARHHRKPVQPGHKPVHRSPVAANGLPRAIADALAKNPVVVVSVVAPRGRVDEVAFREARAGAAAAGAGFVRINAFRQAEVAPLDAKVDIRSNPTLIVIRRPDQVSIQIDGFVDRATIVQAVADARAPRG